jgi:hypothetical protein
MPTAVARWVMVLPSFLPSAIIHSFIHSSSSFFLQNLLLHGFSSFSKIAEEFLPAHLFCNCLHQESSWTDQSLSVSELHFSMPYTKTQ